MQDFHCDFGVLHSNFIVDPLRILSAIVVHIYYTVTLEHASCNLLYALSLGPFKMSGAGSNDRISTVNFQTNTKQHYHV